MGFRGFDLSPCGGGRPLFAVGVVEEVLEVGDVAFGGFGKVLGWVAFREVFGAPCGESGGECAVDSVVIEGVACCVLESGEDGQDKVLFFDEFGGESAVVEVVEILVVVGEEFLGNYWGLGVGCEDLFYVVLGNWECAGGEVLGMEFGGACGDGVYAGVDVCCVLVLVFDAARCPVFWKDFYWGGELYAGDFVAHSFGSRPTELGACVAYLGPDGNGLFVQFVAFYLFL